MPWILYYRLRGNPPADYAGQWDSYWGSVKHTGATGEVLWDTEDTSDLEGEFALFSPHMDAALPLLDLGCGNGRRSRFLAAHFARVVGIDVSQAAVQLARRESGGIENLDYRVANALDPEAAAALHDEFGDLNIYVRGVFHVIQKSDRMAFIDNLRTLLGERGVLYQIETGDAALEYMAGRPDKSPTGLPRAMHKVVEHGILPSAFDAADRRTWYPDDRWEVISEGPTSIQTITLADGEIGQMPAFYTLLRPR